MIQGMGGLLSVTGMSGQGPVRAGLAELSALIADLPRTQSVTHCVDLLNRAGVPAGPVYLVPEMFEDPQVRHLQRTQDMQTPQGPLVTLLTQPVTLTRTPARIVTTAPGWGEHTHELLREAGYSEAEIAAMEAGGVV